MALLAFLGRVGVATAQVRPWTNTGPDGAVAVLATDPMITGTVYVGTPRGMFRSADGGGWSSISSGMTGYERLSVLAVDPVSPTTLYTGGAEGMVYDGAVLYKSTDEGDSWGRTWCCGHVVTALAIDPLTPTTVYAGAHHYLSSSRGVFKSTNGGGTWSPVLTNALVRALAIDRVAPATVYAGTDGGVLRTTDGGATWGAVNAGLTDLNVHALALDPQTPTTLYAGTDAGAFKSPDGGESWSAAGAQLGDLSVSALAIDPATPTTLYAGTSGGGVFKSTDGGGSWSAINDGLTDLSVGALAIDANPTTIYAGTSTGLFALDQSAEPAPAPSFSPDGGTYDQPQTVTLEDGAESATIYYTTDGSTPTTSSTPYTGPIAVTRSTTINAMATGEGMTESEVASATYTLQAATPRFSPTGGTYLLPRRVSISDASPGVTIHYTTDGRPPTTSSARYTGPILVVLKTTIRAIAAAPGWAQSSEAPATYAPWLGLPGRLAPSR